jgi:hypothetical protein
VGIVGCGAGSLSPDGGEPPAHVAVADRVAALEKLSRVGRNEEGEVVELYLYNRRVSNKGLVHLKAGCHGC